MRSVDWIKHTNYVPFWMRHDPLIQNENGDTLAMIWIKNVQTNPPEWMRHDPKINNDYGNTLAMEWVYYVKTEPPGSFAPGNFVPEWMK